MQVSICGTAVTNWHRLGLVQALYGIEALVTVHFCACGQCEGAQPLGLPIIPKNDVRIFCQAVDGLFHAADGINFQYQQHLLRGCMVDESIVAGIHAWSRQVANSSADAVTILSAFLLGGHRRPITSAIAEAVLNTCDEFSLADRVRFCLAHGFQPLIQQGGIMNLWLAAAFGIQLTEDEMARLTH